MLEWIVSGSFLILVVLVLRAALGQKISARFRYALWALVLLRLLVPVQLFTSPVAGMTVQVSEQVREKMDEIIEFAGLGKFIDMPVKTYSSGMHSKLAFSITAVLESDIMLIDEVLSVGDARFKRKSYRKMKQLISNEERTVVIVSHSLETLRKLCTSMLWLHNGKVKMIGEPGKVLDAY